jgi:hypothetical protein
MGGNFGGGAGVSGNEHGIYAVGGSNAGYGAFAQSNTNYSAVYGLCTGASTGSGVQGIKWNGGGGWAGYFQATTGADGGIRSETQGTSGIAGFFFQSNASTGTGQAIYAQADGAGPGIEVYGGTTGVASYGIYAHGRSNTPVILALNANAGGNACGIRAIGGGAAVGAQFQGNSVRGQVLFEPSTTTPTTPLDGELWVENIGAGVMSFCAHLNSQNKVLSHAFWTLTYSASITPIAGPDTQSIVPNNGTAFTINAPALAFSGAILNIQIKNTFGTLGALTFAAAYKTGAAWTQPANGFSRTITFMYNGTDWIEISRTAADVSN